MAPRCQKRNAALTRKGVAHSNNQRRLLYYRRGYLDRGYFARRRLQNYVFSIVVNAHVEFRVGEIREGLPITVFVVVLAILLKPIGFNNNHN
jgi:hypothetical protein